MGTIVDTSNFKGLRNGSLYDFEDLWSFPAVTVAAVLLLTEDSCSSSIQYKPRFQERHPVTESLRTCCRRTAQLRQALARVQVRLCRDIAHSTSSCSVPAPRH